MKHILYILAVMGLLVSCNPYKSQIPEEFVGEWYSQKYGSWDFGFYEESAIYKYDRWDYKSVEKTADGLNLTLSGRDKNVKMCLSFANDSTLSVSVDGQENELFWRRDVLRRNKVVDMSKRDTSAFDLTRTEVGTAVVRYYIYNDMNGFLNAENRLDHFYHDYIVSYNNRLGDMSVKMKYVESDDHYGRLYEATIPVVNVAEFSIGYNASFTEPYTAYGYIVHAPMLVEPGDTVLVLSNGRRKKWHNMWWNDVTYMGTNTSICASAMDIDDAMHSCNYLSISRSTTDYEDGRISYQSLRRLVDEQYFNVCNELDNIWKNSSVPVSEKFRCYLKNALDYSHADNLLCFAECADSVRDNTPLADDCLMLSANAFNYARKLVIRQMVGNNADTLRHLYGDIYDNSWKEFNFDRIGISKLYSKQAIAMGLSRNFIEMSVVYSATSSENCDYVFLGHDCKNRVQLSMHVLGVNSLNKRMTFIFEFAPGYLTKLEQYGKYVYGNIVNEGYKAYFEQAYSEYEKLSSYYKKAIRGERLDENMIHEYEMLTDGNASGYLRSVRNYHGYSSGNECPIIKINCFYPTYIEFYLADNENRSKYIDTLYIYSVYNSYHAYFYKCVKPQRHYSVYAKNRRGKVVKLMDDIFIEDSLTIVYIGNFRLGSNQRYSRNNIQCSIENDSIVHYDFYTKVEPAKRLEKVYLQVYGPKGIMDSSYVEPLSGRCHFKGNFKIGEVPNSPYSAVLVKKVDKSMYNGDYDTYEQVPIFGKGALFFELPNENGASKLKNKCRIALCSDSCGMGVSYLFDNGNLQVPIDSVRVDSAGWWFGYNVDYKKNAHYTAVFKYDSTGKVDTLNNDIWFDRKGLAKEISYSKVRK